MSYFGIPLRNGAAIGLGAFAPLGSRGLSAPSLALNFTSGVLSSQVTFTRATTGTYYNSAGVLQSAAIDTPRFDYNPTTLQPQGLLIEEARTNLLLNSLLDGTNLTTQTVVVTAVATTLSFYGTGTVTLSGAATATVVGTGAYPSRQTSTFTPTAGALILTVTGTVQFAQLEVGAFATSFIPTAAVAVLRAQDFASVTTLTPWYNATEGTLLAIAIPYSPITNPSTQIIASLDNGTGAERDQIARLGGVGTVPGVIVAGNVTIFNAGLSTVWALGAVGKEVIAYKSSDNSFGFNGVLDVPASTAGVATITKLQIGARFDGGIPCNAAIKSIIYYPRRLSNAELQSITV